MKQTDILAYLNKFKGHFPEYKTATSFIEEVVFVICPYCSKKESVHKRAVGNTALCSNCNKVLNVK